VAQEAGTGCRRLTETIGDQVEFSSHIRHLGAEPVRTCAPRSPPTISPPRFC
jgi:hypothetical protein